MPKSLSLAAVVLLAVVPVAPCLAQEYINGPLPTVESSTTTVIKSTAPAVVPVPVAVPVSTTTVITGDSVPVGSRTTVFSTSDPVPASSSTAVVEVEKGVQFKFKERLANLQDQINNGREKGWISVGQAAAFSTEHDRLLGLAVSLEANGFPKAGVDALEKDVTSFSATVTTAMSKP